VKPLYGLPGARSERIRLDEGLISFLARPRFWDCRFGSRPARPTADRTKGALVHVAVFLAIRLKLDRIPSEVRLNTE
jgi:hypothetical protein